MTNLPEMPDAQIDIDDVLLLLVEACPSFAPILNCHVNEAAATGEPLLHYLVIPTFAEHLGSLARHDNLSEFPAVFATIDQVLTMGDESARSLTRELVEDLTHWSSAACNPAAFAPFWGLAAREWIERHRATLVDDAAEGAADLLLDLLIERNLAELTAHLPSNYWPVSRMIIHSIDDAQMTGEAMVQRLIWASHRQILGEDAAGPLERYANIARQIWSTRGQDSAGG